jgi:putative transposase
MPRASEYLLEGYTYHLTHRCHDRRFLLRFAKDRNAYRKWLLEGVKRIRVPVYGYCITGNHVHVIVHADRVEDVSALMHLAAGSTAKQYNLRKNHLGAVWEHPYQCTVIQDGTHLFNCLCYVDLNMIRAGAVERPEGWPWCGYHELVGKRQRYAILDIDRLLQSLDIGDMATFRDVYADAIERRLSSGRKEREGVWTESLAVGSKPFVEQVQKKQVRRTRFDLYAVESAPSETWAVRESGLSYGSFSAPKRASKGSFEAS